MVVRNTFFVLFGDLPTTSHQTADKLSRIGNNSSIKSHYTLGVIQTGLEIILILLVLILLLHDYYIINNNDLKFNLFKKTKKGIL
jgi:hypothetical protein